LMDVQDDDFGILKISETFDLDYWKCFVSTRRNDGKPDRAMGECDFFESHPFCSSRSRSRSDRHEMRIQNFRSHYKKSIGNLSKSFSLIGISGVL
jgi:hypothetical protein